MQASVINPSASCDPGTRPEQIHRTNRTNDSDYALARAAASGVMTGLGDLYERHWNRVYALCLRMTHSPAEAEDLTQEVFIQVLRTIRQFRGESQFTTWLHRLTINHVLMHFRRTKGRKEKHPTDSEPFSIKPRPAGAQVLDRIALKSALATLPSGCRAIFLLFDVEGYKHEEIAMMCGCSVGNSKSQLHRARRKLRQLLRYDNRHAPSYS